MRARIDISLTPAQYFREAPRQDWVPWPGGTYTFFISAPLFKSGEQRALLSEASYMLSTEHLTERPPSFPLRKDAREQHGSQESMAFTHRVEIPCHNCPATLPEQSCHTEMHFITWYQPLPGQKVTCTRIGDQISVRSWDSSATKPCPAQVSVKPPVNEVRTTSFRACHLFI